MPRRDYVRGKDVALRIMALTNGEGVGAACYAVGADTFEGSFASLSIKGHPVQRLMFPGLASGLQKSRGRFFGLTTPGATNSLAPRASCS